MPLATEDMVALDRLKMAKSLAGLRASARPRDLLGRVQLLLLAFALANLVGAFVVTGASSASPLPLYIAALAAEPVLALTWVWVYRRRSFSVAAEVIVVGSICVFALAVDARWHEDVVAILTAAIFAL